MKPRPPVTINDQIGRSLLGLEKFTKLTLWAFHKTPLPVALLLSRMEVSSIEVKIAVLRMHRMHTHHHKSGRGAWSLKQ